MQKKTSGDIYESKRWGLPAEAVGGLGDRLSHQWEQYRGFFKTRTRDSAKHAWTYLRGLLGMQMKRNCH